MLTFVKNCMRRIETRKNGISRERGGKCRNKGKNCGETIQIYTLIEFFSRKCWNTYSQRIVSTELKRSATKQIAENSLMAILVGFKEFFTLLINYETHIYLHIFKNSLIEKLRKFFVDARDVFVCFLCGELWKDFKFHHHNCGLRTTELKEVKAQRAHSKTEWRCARKEFIRKAFNIIIILDTISFFVCYSKSCAFFRRGENNFLYCCVQFPIFFSATN